MVYLSCNKMHCGLKCHADFANQWFACSLHTRSCTCSILEYYTELMHVTAMSQLASTWCIRAFFHFQTKISLQKENADVFVSSRSAKLSSKYGVRVIPVVREVSLRITWSLGCLVHRGLCFRPNSSHPWMILLWFSSWSLIIVEWQRNSFHSSVVTHIVQMLIFNPEEVPNSSTDNLQTSQYHIKSILVAHKAERLVNSHD